MPESAPVVPPDSRRLRPLGRSLCLALTFVGLTIASPGQTPTRQDPPKDDPAVSESVGDPRRGFLAERWFGQDDDGGELQLPYRVHRPELASGAPPPALCLVLHAERSRGTDNVSTLRGIPTRLEAFGKEEPAVLVVPQCPTGRTWLAGDDRASILGALDSLLTEIVDGTTLDRDRIYLVGDSMGADAALALARRTSLPIAGILVSGVGRTGDELEQVPADCPVWVWHGEFDPLAEVRRVRAFAERNRSLGRFVLFTEVPSAGHDAWRDAFLARSGLRWLFARRRGDVDLGIFVVDDGARLSWRETRSSPERTEYLSWDPAGSNGVGERRVERFRTFVDLDRSPTLDRTAVAYREGGLAILRSASGETVESAITDPGVSSLCFVGSDRVLVSHADLDRVACYRLAFNGLVGPICELKIEGPAALSAAGDGSTLWCLGASGLHRLRLDADVLSEDRSVSWPGGGDPSAIRADVVVTDEFVVVLQQGRILWLKTEAGQDFVTAELGPFSTLESPIALSVAPGRRLAIHGLESTLLMSSPTDRIGTLEGVGPVGSAGHIYLWR